MSTNSPIKIAAKAFFDRQSVIREIGKRQAKVLNEQGRILQRQARSLIKKRKGPSRPGSAPHSHFGQLKRFLFRKYDSASKSVVVGPEKLGAGFYSAPEALEYSGRTKAKKNPRRVDRKIGDGGVVEIAGRGKKFKNRITVWKSVKDIDGKRRRVAFAKLTTDKMLAHADKLETIIWGPKTIPAMNIEARPFMGPALNLSKDSLAAVWRDQLH